MAEVAWQVVQTSVILYISYIAVLFLYHFFRSPLQGIPGPLISRFSILWHLWHIFKGDYSQATVQAHQKYGPLVRISYNEVSVCSADAVRLILLKPLDKGPWYKIFAIPDSTWTNQMCETSASRFALTQKKIAAGYSLSNIIRSEDEFDVAIARLEARIDESIYKDEIISLDKWFAFFAFDIVGQTTFSQAFGFLERGVDVGGCVATSHALVTYLSFMAYFHKWHDLLMANPLIEYFDLQPMRHVMATTEKAVRTREKNSKARNDMIERWKRQTSDTPLTSKDLLSAANANVAAGAETVGTALQAFVYQMLQHPKCLARLRNEIDEAAAVGKLASPVRWSAAQDLTYFHACLKETFRFHPVSATSYPRVAPKGGFESEGTFLPEGTIVSVNPWAIHRDPSIWGPDVDEFRPERWLQPTSSRLESYLISFGAGYMRCPGRSLALIEMSKLLPTLFLDYDIELATPEEEWKIARAFVARPFGWSVVMKRRQMNLRV